MGLLSKTATLHLHHAFLYISLPSLYDYDVKMPNFTLYGGRKQATSNFSFSFLNLGAVPKKSTLTKFAQIWHFQRIGINATVFEKTRVPFQSDIFASVAFAGIVLHKTWRSMGKGLPPTADYNGRNWQLTNLLLNRFFYLVRRITV